MAITLPLVGFCKWRIFHTNKIFPPPTKTQAHSVTFALAASSPCPPSPAEAAASSLAASAILTVRSSGRFEVTWGGYRKRKGTKEIFPLFLHEIFSPLTSFQFPGRGRFLERQ